MGISMGIMEIGVTMAISARLGDGGVWSRIRTDTNAGYHRENVYALDRLGVPNVQTHTHREKPGVSRSYIVRPGEHTGPMEVWQTIMIPTRLTPWIVTNNSNNIITGPRGLFFWLDGNFIKCQQLCSPRRGNHLHSVSLVSWNDQQLSNKHLYRFQHVLMAFWNPVIHSPFSHSVRFFETWGIYNFPLLWLILVLVS